MKNFLYQQNIIRNTPPRHKCSLFVCRNQFRQELFQSTNKSICNQLVRKFTQIDSYVVFKQFQVFHLKYQCDERYFPLRRWQPHREKVLDCRHNITLNNLPIMFMEVSWKTIRPYGFYWYLLSKKPAHLPQYNKLIKLHIIFCRHSPINHDMYQIMCSIVIRILTHLELK